MAANASTLPIVCTLTPEALRARREGLLPALFARSDSMEKLADGYCLLFTASDDILPAIVRTIDAERRCCRFLRFVLTVEPDAGQIVLRVTGPPGTVDFLEALADEQGTAGAGAA
jgi:hypothetical protein